MNREPSLIAPRSMRLLALLAVSLGTLSCGDDDSPSDAGADAMCDAVVRVGTSESGEFTTLVDGSDVELVLGFQGFRMLRLALAVDHQGAPAGQAEVSAFVTIDGTEIELGQRTRERLLRTVDGGFVLDDWFVFFNDTPPSTVVGREATLEVIVRAAGCVGGTTLHVTVVDESDCVDPTIMVDAGVADAGADAGLGDAAVCSQ